MKLTKTVLLAVSALAVSFGAAAAGGHDHGGRQGGGDRGGGNAGASRTDQRGGAGGYFGGVITRYDRGARDGVPQGYAPRGYAPPSFERPSYNRGGRYVDEGQAPAFASPSRPLRRGQYMPRDYWAGGITDPHSRHLRTPPPGYRWVGVGRDAYLMQRSTGLILDSVPGAY